MLSRGYYTYIGLYSSCVVCSSRTGPRVNEGRSWLSYHTYIVARSWLTTVTNEGV